MNLTIDESNADVHRGGFVGTGGFYIRPFHHAKGAQYQGHSHYIDHVGNLVSGKVRVHWSEGDESGVIDMLVPCKIHMPAGRHHRLEIIEDAVWECWFAQAEADKIYGDDTKIDWNLEAHA